MTAPRFLGTATTAVVWLVASLTAPPRLHAPFLALAALAAGGTVATITAIWIADRRYQAFLAATLAASDARIRRLEAQLRHPSAG